MMERGGAAAISVTAGVNSGNLFRVRNHPRFVSAAVPCRRCSRCSAVAQLSGRIRFFCCWRGQKHPYMHNTTFQSLRRVSSSTGPQETVLNSDEMRKDKLLIDCGPDQECVLGGIVALGKFDALHIGHRQLAIHASKAGTPFLLSFVGMAEVLGWEPRPPIVAKCDRKRVLSSWAPYCGNVTPIEYEVEFSNVRHLTPRQFVERLSKELRISGVVAGENYRFGYKASGDAAELVRLCDEYGLTAIIVSPIMDKTMRSFNGIGNTNSRDMGQVSSTRVRRALAMGDTDYVSELLGRRHRLVLMLEKQFCSGRRVSAPKSCALNQAPKDGLYRNCTVMIDDVLTEPAIVNINEEGISIECIGGSSIGPFSCQDSLLIGIEF